MVALTNKQQQVLAALQEADVPLSAYELLDRLRDHGFSAPMQVYRVLERLVAEELVHRLATLNAYLPCNHPHGCHHHLRAFVICDQCGHVDEFTNHELSDCLQRSAKSKAFTLHSSAIELHGQCANCAEQSTTEI